MKINIEKTKVMRDVKLEEKWRTIFYYTGKKIMNFLYISCLHPMPPFRGNPSEFRCDLYTWETTHAGTWQCRPNMVVVAAPTQLGLQQRLAYELAGPMNLHPQLVHMITSRLTWICVNNTIGFVPEFMAVL